MQLDDEDYDNPEDKYARETLSSRQYLAFLKANSDAERGKSGYHGVAMRSNDRWQSRITGVAVRYPPLASSFRFASSNRCTLATCGRMCGSLAHLR